MFLKHPEYQEYFAQIHEKSKSDPSILGTTFEAFTKQVGFMPLRMFIDGFRQLPDDIMRRHGILMPFEEKDDESCFFSSVRKGYRARADWLKYYELEEYQLIDELRLTQKAFYEKNAIIDRAYLSLAKECLLLSDPLRNYAKGNAGFLWYLIQSEMCEEMMRTSGFTGEPSLIGKKTQYELIRKAVKEMENPKILEGKKAEALHSPTRILLNEAMLIAQMPENHSFRAKYNNFLQQLKQCSRDIERSELNNIYLVDGKIQIIGRGKRNQDKQGRRKRRKN